MNGQMFMERYNSKWKQRRKQKNRRHGLFNFLSHFCNIRRSTDPRMQKCRVWVNEEKTRPYFATEPFSFGLYFLFTYSPTYYYYYYWMDFFFYFFFRVVGYNHMNFPYSVDKTRQWREKKVCAHNHRMRRKKKYFFSVIFRCMESSVRFERQERKSMQPSKLPSPLSTTVDTCRKKNGNSKGLESNRNRHHFSVVEGSLIKMIAPPKQHSEWE